ncbi:hypothetical protein AXM70_10685 [Salmonella enterica subsp. enterica]|nr:hypothetical protein [Salmonella enterica subsp. enterica]
MRLSHVRLSQRYLHSLRVPYASARWDARFALNCASYREFNHAEGYRVLYSVEGILVTAYMILSPKQDIPRLLFKRLIMA